MKNLVLGMFLASLLVLAACSQQTQERQQSIQEILTKTGEYNTTSVPNIEEEKPVINLTVNETVTKEEPIENATFIVDKKCRYSAVQYGGCKWTDNSHDTFTLVLQSSSKYAIPGVWFVITGDSGSIMRVKRPESILSLGRRTFTVDYSDLVKTVGIVKKFEVYPIEVINDTEYACENQRVYTIPEVYCKSATPVRINPDGSINQSS